jgi:2-hydroxychromene-2-carboxylate isomerase
VSGAAGLADSLARRTAPRALAASANFTLPARLAAASRRRRGARATLELYFAFDDPCSAVAVAELWPRLRTRALDVRMQPVIRRGIPGDPAVAHKRDYALLDARRLARRRLGLTLARQSILPAGETAFLAEWVAAGPQGPELAGFCSATLGRLWFEEARPVRREELAALWREWLGTQPVPDAGAVRRCEARMARRGPYETPAVWTAGRWYFAQDRPTQICDWLDELGWTER